MFSDVVVAVGGARGSGMDDHERRSKSVWDPAPDVGRAENRDEVGNRGARRREMRIGDVLQIEPKQVAGQGRG
jgi:hypothetical protein